MRIPRPARRRGRRGVPVWIATLVLAAATVLGALASPRAGDAVRDGGAVPGRGAPVTAGSAAAWPAGPAGGADGGGLLTPDRGTRSAGGPQATDVSRSRAPAPDPAPAPDRSPAPARAPAPERTPTAEPAPRPAPPDDTAAPPESLAPEGWLVAGGRSPVAGVGGRLTTYTVEMADGLQARQSLDGFAAVVTSILSDPHHGWTADGTLRLQRIEDATAADLRVVLADAARVDELCARAGLDTMGRYSCWNGELAALNADRWFAGVPHVADQSLYRTYLVNHEVGHGLGHGHEECPGEGRLAPVMMQLSVSAAGCVPNGVPFPDGAAPATSR